MTAKQILKNNYGDEAEAIYEELRTEVQDALATGAKYDDIEGILLVYGLEMDYIFEFI